MKRRDREIGTFSLSMLDVISGGLGAFLFLTLLLLPYYKRENIELKLRNDALRDTVQETRVSLAAARVEASEIDRLAARIAEARDSVRAAAARAGSSAELARRVQATRDSAGELREQERKFEERTGIALRRRNLVFLLDASGSLSGGPLEEVGAGLRLLAATMDESYRLDLVFFPNARSGAEFGALWRGLRPVTEERKYELYRFVAALGEPGGAPADAAIGSVLTGADYADVGELIVLSDGQPPDWSREIVDHITALNGGRVIINVVGIGPDFRDRTSTAPPKRFLEELAARNGGFLVGF